MWRIMANKQFIEDIGPTSRVVVHMFTVQFVYYVCTLTHSLQPLFHLQMNNRYHVQETLRGASSEKGYPDQYPTYFITLSPIRKTSTLQLGSLV